MKYIQTDGYRAPEAELQNCLAQAGLQSDAECTSAVDLWSLGIILLEMFSGMKLKHTVRSQEWKVPRRAWRGGQCSARRRLAERPALASTLLSLHVGFLTPQVQVC